MRAKTLIATAAVLSLTTLAAVQVLSVQRLQSELELIRRQLEGSTAPPTDAASFKPAVRRVPGESTPSGLALAERVAELERAVASLNKAAEYLTERGHLPLGEDQLPDLYSRLRDPNATDESRLHVLRLLRHGRAMNEEAVNFALGWLQTVSDPKTKRELVHQFDGVTNAAIKAPMLA